MAEMDARIWVWVEGRGQAAQGQLAAAGFPGEWDEATETVRVAVAPALVDLLRRWQAAGETVRCYPSLEAAQADDGAAPFQDCLLWARG